MHVLYVHPNFPAQFGHIANYLVKEKGWRCTFISETPPGTVGGIEKIQYKIAGGATIKTHFCARTFENSVWHCDAVFQAMKARPDIHPDLIVGHSGFGSTLFLRELYPDVPVVNLFEYYYHPHGPESDMDFRQDLGWATPEIKYLRSRCRNAMILLDLKNCNVGYCPTEFQRSRFPADDARNLKVVFDGVDRQIYHGFNGELRKPGTPRRIAGRDIPPNTRIVTYVSRGFESMRGFDIFMRVAKRIMQQYPDVLFFVVGADRIAYGGDADYIGGKSFKDWVLSREEFDLSRFVFTGLLPQPELARLLATTDLHIYLTVPFVLSWSMMDAMSCGAVVLGSATPPVKEMIREGQNGLLADFFDIENFARKAIDILKDPQAYRPLGNAAEEMIEQRYSLDRVVPEMVKLYESARAT
ncbi:MAG TPA: glycosyltransferase [Tepidisphaeraceae bacterium]|jgi:glycosyltransferase involved in cell wall biosynthesis|nr:glycosyltransferase [Tepidisphaeraceae bacterium]